MMYRSLAGTRRLCGLEQELVLNGEKHVRLSAGSAEELLEGCMVHVGFFWSDLLMCLSLQSSKVFWFRSL